MLITYHYVQQALEKYERTLPWYKILWYMIRGEPKNIRLLQSIAHGNPQSSQALSSGDLFMLATIILKYSELKKYFMGLENDSETRFFLKSASSLSKAKNLNPDRLSFYMEQLTKHFATPLMPLLDKLDKANPRLFNSDNVEQLITYQEIFNYEKGSLLLEGITQQFKLDGIFSLCRTYSSDTIKARTMLELYVFPKKFANGSYELIFSRGVTPVPEQPKLRVKPTKKPVTQQIYAESDREQPVHRVFS